MIASAPATRSIEESVERSWFSESLHQAGPVWVLVAFLAVVAVFAVVKMKKERYTLAVLCCVALTASLMALLDPSDLSWAWTLSLVPAAMVIEHAAFLGMVRKGHIPGPGSKLSSDEGRIAAAQDVLDRGKAVRDEYFSVEALAIRFGLPALLLVVVGLGYALLLFTSPSKTLIPELVAPDAEAKLIHNVRWTAATLGLAGSYVYVLLYLSQRAFRRDITSGAAMWCVATLAMGPILAIVCTVIWAPSAEVQKEGISTVKALYFFAGLAPRHLAELVSTTVRRLFPGSAENSAAPKRYLPLSLVRGIVPVVEERLAEEGIQDVATLAFCDPFRLLRTTNFDKRQILNWMDEAMLIHVFPESWKKIQDAGGLTGAVDLAWSHFNKQKKAAASSTKADVSSTKADVSSTKADVSSTEADVTSTEADVTSTELAKVAGMNDVVFGQIIKRLSEDYQVQAIWTLYQTADDKHGLQTESNESKKT